MSAHDTMNEFDRVVDADLGWTIHRCGHGCVHLTLDRVSVALTDAEFDRLLELMHRTRTQWPASPHYPAAVRSH